MQGSFTLAFHERMNVRAVNSPRMITVITPMESIEDAHYSLRCKEGGESEVGKRSLQRAEKHYT